MKEPKYKIGDTVVLYRRWFLWFRNYVLCEIVGGYYAEEEYIGINKIRSGWRYTLKVGNQFRRFCMWEDELLSN